MSVSHTSKYPPKNKPYITGISASRFNKFKSLFRSTIGNPIPSHPFDNPQEVVQNYIKGLRVSNRTSYAWYPYIDEWDEVCAMPDDWWVDGRPEQWHLPNKYGPCWRYHGGTTCQVAGIGIRNFLQHFPSRRQEIHDAFSCVLVLMKSGKVSWLHEQLRHPPYLTVTQTLMHGQLHYFVGLFLKYENNGNTLKMLPAGYHLVGENLM